MTSLDAALSAIWERSKPVVADRLAAIEAATHATPDEHTVAEGVRAAHQLAGSLGTFGIHEGSDVARAIEAELQGRRDAGRLGELSGRLAALLRPRLR